MVTEWADLPAGLNDPARRLVREIRAAKDSAGLSLAQLAVHTHYSRASWERWLNGKRLVTPIALAGFARVTGIDGVALAELLGRASLEGGPEDSAPTASAPQPADAPAAESPASQRERATVAQLPASIPDFTGRSAQIETIVDVLTRREAAGAGQTPVVVVCAGGGVGKTTLAVHVAHQVSAQYPDGALYVDLRGVDENPRDPADVLAGWLRALGDESGAATESLDDRANRFRSLVRDKALLVLLDNARDAAQIRPLLPATERGAVIVTSRTLLAHLPAALRVQLEPMTYSESLTLLENVAGADRTGREPKATATVLDACAGLPLALRICAARLETRPSWSMQTLAERISGAHRRLDELAVGDLATRSSFDMSYAQLAQEVDEPGVVSPARAFRLLGLAALPGIGLKAASALFGVDPDRAEYALEALVDVHLLESPSPERYRFHDLIGLYAAERGATEPEAEQNAAVRRLAGWYLYANETAIALLSNPDPAPAPPGLLLRTPTIEFPGYAEALAWLDLERAALVEISRLAERFALHDVAARLPSTLLHYANLRGLWDDFEAVNEVALRAARATGEEKDEAIALNGLGWVYRHTSRSERAMATLSQALKIWERLGVPSGEAASLELMCTLAGESGDGEAALEFQRRALEKTRQIDDPHRLLRSIGNLALEYARMGRAEEFFELSEEALASARAMSINPVVAALLEAAGEVHLAQGRALDAKDALVESVELFTELGNRPALADALEYLGNAYAAVEDDERATASWAEAVAIFDTCDPPRSEAIRARMSSSGSATRKAG